MSRIVSIRVPESIYRDLSHHARSRGMNLTEATRDLLRRALGVADDGWDSGYQEGKIAAHRDIMKRLNGVGDNL